MNTHSIELDGYYARSRGNSTIYLGTAGSHGNEQLQVTPGKGWEGLTVQVVFHPSKVAVQLPADGLLDVPWEATENPLTAMQGRIVFQGFDQDRLVNSTDLAYTVASHSPVLGRDEEPYTPGIVEGVLNQMAADKDAILQAAQQTGQAKEAAAASATEAAGSAANAQQSAGAANTSAGQAAASASQAAGSAAAAGETLTQVQTAGQEAQQKVKDSETEALDKIAAAAPALPAVSSDAAWQSVTVKPDGTGYNLAALAPIEATIRPTATGNPAVCENSAAWGLQGLKIYGKSVQNGTPSPENPVPIANAGENGSIELALTGKNLLNPETMVFNGAFSSASIHDASGTKSFVFRVKGFSKIFVSRGNLTGNFFRFIQSNYSGPVEKLSDVPVESFIDKTFLNDSDVSFWELCINPDANYLLCYFWSESSTYSLDDILNALMISIDSENYEPYTGQTLTLATPGGLPGIPVTNGSNYTDSTGQKLVCNVIGPSGITQYAKEIVLDGSSDENWLLQKISTGDSYRAVISINDLYYESTVNSVNFLCDRFKVDNIGGGVEPDIATVYSNRANLFFYNNLSNDLAAWRNWLAQNPVTICYPTTDIVTTPLSNEELAAYRALQTYAGTTVVSTAEPVAGLEVQYVADGTKYAEKVQSMETRLAALEAAQTGI